MIASETAKVDYNQLILLGIAVCQVISAGLAYLTHRSAKRTEVNMELVEKATNSMKDALVAASEKKGFVAGEAAQRLRTAEDKQ